MKYIFFLLGFLVCSTAASAQTERVSKKDVKKVAAYMTGDFSSEEQSLTDTNFFHIKLHIRRIWKEKKDGYWLYVEQASAKAEHKPYRQRVYHVFLQNDTAVASQVYELRQAEQFAGGWAEPEKLKALTNESLSDRQGCVIYLKKNKDKTYTGTTPGKECLSSLRGSLYATSEVVLTPDKLVSWDRGWDKSDRQVWGSTKGAYIFKKLSDK